VAEISVEARLSLSGEQLKALARQGAAQRYQELQDELAALTATFPELARGKRGKAASSAPSAASRRRRSMNAAQRKEVSERMTRYWASRRAEKAAGAGTTGKGKGRRRKAAKKAVEAKKAE
jgi:hypothetical protein